MMVRHVPDLDVAIPGSSTTYIIPCLTMFSQDSHLHGRVEKWVRKKIMATLKILHYSYLLDGLLLIRTAFQITV